MCGCVECKFLTIISEVETSDALQLHNIYTSSCAIHSKVPIIVLWYSMVYIANVTGFCAVPCESSQVCD